MSKAKFILSKKKVLEQYKSLADLGLKVSYSYKTNQIVGDVLQEFANCDFSIHNFKEIEKINDKSKIWFFSQAWSREEVCNLIEIGVRSFVIDSKDDLKILLDVLEEEKVKINLSLRMKFFEHRIGTGKYFVYGFSSEKVNRIIKKLENNEFVEKLGVHIHRKTQNTSEWEIVEDLRDSLSDEFLKRIDFVNLGGGLPAEYKNSNIKILDYIFEKIKETKKWLGERGIEIYIEPGRFIAAPAVKLETEVIRVSEGNVVLNTTIYNCALDTLLTNTRMLVEGEISEGKNYLIKGNSPTRDDIFRYSIFLNEVRVGDKIVFLNAGAYNYATDFFGYEKLETEIVEYFPTLE